MSALIPTRLAHFEFPKFAFLASNRSLVVGSSGAASRWSGFVAAAFVVEIAMPEATSPALDDPDQKFDRLDEVASVRSARIANLQFESVGFASVYKMPTWQQPQPG